MLPRLSRFFWALTLVTLPVTSFRYLPFVGSGTYVRPLALIPLALLLPILLVRLRLRQIPRPWPGQLTILAAFALVALASSAWGQLLAPLELRGVEVWDRALRAFVTLAVGLAFFLAAVWMNQEEADLKFSARWLLLGLILHLAWGAIQFYGLNHGYRSLLNQIQQSFSVRGLVKNKRVSGFAFEPSWLAGQIVTLYLPWLVAGLLVRFRESLFPLDGFLKKWRLSGAWVEAGLLLGALAALLMTYSRSGLLVTVLAAAITLFASGGALLRSGFGWFRAGFGPDVAPGRWARLQAAGSRMVLILLAVSVLAGAGFFLADKGYIARFFTSEKENLPDYLVSVYLGPRLAYAVSALEAFQQHPLTGVGLGASGFWMYRSMPDWVLSGVPEIAEQMSPDAGQFPNPKNLFVRLLAETGLVGFMLFVAFYLATLADVLELLRQPGSAARWLGTAGLFAFTAVLLQGGSQDSLAMPEMWINLGLLIGAAGALIQPKE